MSWVLVHYNNHIDEEIFHVTEDRFVPRKSRWRIVKKIMPLVLFILRQI